MIGVFNCSFDVCFLYRNRKAASATNSGCLILFNFMHSS